jgi:phosphate-selective porin OprO/OprP
MRNFFLTGFVLTGLTGLGLTLESTASLAGNEIEFDKKGIHVESADGKLELNLGGRIHLDAATFADDITPLDSEADFRRARVELAIRFLDDFRFRVDYDFSDVSRGWKNVWGSWEFADGFEVQLGNFTAPFSMEDVMSSNNITFMERSLPNAMATGFLLGGAVSAHGESWTVALGFFEEPIDDEEDRKETAGDGVAGRVTFLPWRNDDALVHIGAGFEARDLESGSGFRLRTRPESALASSRLLDTGTLANVDQFTTLNLEAAWRDGPFSVQGQYVHMWVDRSGIADPEFKGWYAQASWVLTGEKRNYSNSSGVFTTVEPEGDYGAFEIALRYSTLDLEDETVNGGEETNITAGINWYVTDYMRVMANFINAELHPNRSGVDEDVQIGQARLQLNL